MDLDPKIINDWKFIKYVSAQKMIGVEEDFVKDRLERVCETMKDVIKAHEQYMAYGAEKNFTFPLTAFQNTVDADHINAVVTITQKDDNNTMQAITIETNWDAIVNLMDDDIREKVHFEMVPCTEEAFLQRYLQLDPDFENVLQTEFGIEMEEENVRL